MKKIISFAVSAVAILTLSGCGGGTDVYVDDGPVPETYFITDGYGDGVSGIIYHCDSGYSGVTNFEGAFTFDIIGDNCNFDFLSNDIVADVHIEYDNDPYTDAGIDGIYFECVYDGSIDLTGYTGPSGFIADASLYDGCTLFDIY